MADHTEATQSGSAHINWGPVAAVVVSFGIYIAAQVIVGVVFSLLPLLWGWNTARVQTWLDTSLLAQFVSVVLIEAASLYMLWLFLKSRKAKFSDIGLVRPRLQDIWRALTAFGVYYLLLMAATQVASQLIPSLNLEQEQQLGFDKATSGLSLVPIFISLVILPPLVEEILARGFLYTGLRKKLPIVVSAIITSLLFAAAHLQFGSGNALLWVAAIDTFMLSLVLVYLREKTGSLWAPILLHMIKNGVAFTYLFILSA